MIVGLTGSIGMGKTTVSHMIRKNDIPVLCLDGITHAARAPNGPAVNAIQNLIPDCLDENGGVDAVKLRAFAYSDPDNIPKIEAIMRPIIDAQIDQFIKVVNDVGGVGVIDAPLLFEKGLDERCDIVVVVTARPSIQRERVLARGNMTEEQLAIIMARQMPDAEKRAKANFLIYTDTSLDKTEQQVVEVFRPLQ